MSGLGTHKRVVRVTGVLLAAILVLLAAWIAAVGPVPVFRMLRYGDTNIDDFTHYPGRQLLASEAPFNFERSNTAFALPAEALLEYGGQGELERVLETNDSIAFLVLRGDTILYERYFQGHTPSSLSQGFSMSKSVTSTLIGMAIDDGYLSGVDQAITELVPELTEKGFGQVHLHDLLTMMSGSSYVENDNPFGQHVVLNFAPDLEGQILAFTMEQAPGQLFRYKSGDNALLGLALDRALGAETITDYAQRRLWTPLGMEADAVWTIDHEGDGLEKTWCCLAATARDYAKLGRLYLSGGTWNGQRLISEDWVSQSTRVGQVPDAAWPEEYLSLGRWNYGYQWWLASPEEGDFFALGKDGQFVYVHPTANLVIVRLGWSEGGLRTEQWVAMFQAIAHEVLFSQSS